MPLFRLPRLSWLLYSATALLFTVPLASCSGDYCLRCVDLSMVREDIEGCDNDLEGLQSARDFWEGEGYACVIFDN